MASKWHMFLLRRSVSLWNASRTRYLNVHPNLSWANLRRANLSWANLEEADLIEADLSGASLYGADLSGANLQRVNLRRVSLRRASLYGVNLEKANLQEANLQEANLQEANLQGANLQGANLTSVNFTGANLQSCRLDGAIVDRTIFADVDLRDVQGLDMVRHTGPSHISIDTLYKSRGDISEVFLRGCGVPDPVIEYAYSLMAAERPIDYYSVFISYSSKDEALAKRLHADLQAAGVRCWYAPEDLKIGESILGGIDQGIRLHDKLLLLLSESSVNSAWVDAEVQMALVRERTERRRVLFPVRIDDAVLTSGAAWGPWCAAIITLGIFARGTTMPATKRPLPACCAT